MIFQLLTSIAIFSWSPTSESRVVLHNEFWLSACGYRMQQSGLSKGVVTCKNLWFVMRFYKKKLKTQKSPNFKFLKVFFKEKTFKIQILDSQ